MTNSTWLGLQGTRAAPLTASSRESNMPGERFSELYLRQGDLAQDSGRARHRVGALFGETVLNTHAKPLADHLGRQLGVPVPGDGRHLSDWQQFIRECRT